MKKVLATLVIFLALLSSCTLPANQEESQEITSTFQEVDYKGHSYIIFMYHQKGAYTGYGGLTHNPDCKCQKGGQYE